MSGDTNKDDGADLAELELNLAALASDLSFGLTETDNDPLAALAALGDEGLTPEMLAAARRNEFSSPPSAPVPPRAQLSSFADDDESANDFDEMLQWVQNSGGDGRTSDYAAAVAGLSFGGSFSGSSSMSSAAAVKTLFNQEGGVTLEQVLDLEFLTDFIQLDNQLLLDFFSKEESMQGVVGYLTLPYQPSTIHESEETRSTARRATLCREVITAKKPPLLAALRRPQCLSALFSYFSSEPPLPRHTTANLCSMLVNVFDHLANETLETMRQQHTLAQLVRHIDHASVAEYLIKMVDIASMELDDANQPYLTFLIEENLVPLLVEQLHSALPSSSHEAAADLLAALVTKHPPLSPLILNLQDESVMSRLFAILLDPASVSSQTYVAQTLTSVVRGLADMPATGDGSLTDDSELDELHPVLKFIVDQLPRAVPLLRAQLPFAIEVNDYDAVAWARCERFFQLKLLEFLTALVSTNYLCIDSVLADLNFFAVVVEMFEMNPRNNFLHSIVVDMTYVIFSGDSVKLKLHLLDECLLMGRLLRTAALDEECAAGGGNKHLGSIAHVKEIVSQIVDCDDEELHQFLQGNAEHKERWAALVARLEAERHENEAPLGGERPKKLPLNMPAKAGLWLSHLIGMSTGGDEVEDEDEEEDDEEYADDEDDDDDDEDDDEDDDDDDDADDVDGGGDVGGDALGNHDDPDADPDATSSHAGLDLDVGGSSEQDPSAQDTTATAALPGAVST